MASTPPDPCANQTPPASTCDIKALLAEVNAEIKKQEILKLPELKQEIEAYLQEKTPAEEDYKAKRDALVNRWKAETSVITQIGQTLSCACPNWEKIISTDICAFFKSMAEIKAAIESSKKCKGPNEKALAEATEALEAAKTIKENWKNAAAKIAETLDRHDAWIKQIQDLAQGKDHVFRIYLLWCKLIPSHNALQPDGETQSPIVIGKPLSALCKEADDSSDTRSTPWLVSVDDYSGKLDCAFQAYKEAKVSVAAAAGKYEADKDDYESLVAKLKAKKDQLDTDVKEQLAKVCCHDNQGTKAAA